MVLPGIYFLTVFFLSFFYPLFLCWFPPPQQATFARDVDSLLIVVASGTPTTHTMIQLASSALAAGEVTMSQRPTSEWQRVLPLSTVSGSAWRVSLLPCGPIASLAGTFPAQCMAYASFTRSQGATDEWLLVRCRLRLFTDATSERVTTAEHVISSENLRGGTVFGCGVVSHRPHFLRCVCVVVVVVVVVFLFLFF